MNRANTTLPFASWTTGVSSSACEERDLAGDKEKFNQKFTDFIRAHPSEAEGLAAYEALPD
jgi:hypothetical protein